MTWQALAGRRSTGTVDAHWAPGSFHQGFILLRMIALALLYPTNWISKGLFVPRTQKSNVCVIGPAIGLKMNTNPLPWVVPGRT